MVPVAVNTADVPPFRSTVVLMFPVPEVERTLRELASEYVADGRGFELRQTKNRYVQN